MTSPVKPQLYIHLLIWSRYCKSSKATNSFSVCKACIFYSASTLQKASKWFIWIFNNLLIILHELTPTLSRRAYDAPACNPLWTKNFVSATWRWGKKRFLFHVFYFWNLLFMLCIPQGINFIRRICYKCTLGSILAEVCTARCRQHQQQIFAVSFFSSARVYALLLRLHVASVH